MDRHAWDSRYAEREFVWSAEPNLFLPPAVEGLGPGRSLDLAAGEGRNSLWLASQGWECTAVDFSQVALDKGRRNADAAGLTVDWVVDDVLSYTPDPAFDLVLIFYVHLMEPDMERLFGVAKAALKPGGHLIGVGHALRNLTEGVGGPPVPEILWTVERAQRLLDGLEVLTLEERERVVRIDPTHQHTAEEGIAIDVFAHASFGVTESSPL